MDEREAMFGGSYGERQKTDERGLLVPFPLYHAIPCPECDSTGALMNGEAVISACPVCKGRRAVRVNLHSLEILEPRKELPNG